MREFTRIRAGSDGVSPVVGVVLIVAVSVLLVGIISGPIVEVFGGVEEEPTASVTAEASQDGIDITLVDLENSEEVIVFHQGGETPLSELGSSTGPVKGVVHAVAFKEDASAVIATYEPSTYNLVSEGELAADSETVGVGVSGSGVQPGELRVTEISAPDTVNRESELVVSYELENIGDLGTMENIVFSLNSQQIDFKQISVAPGQTVSDEFTYQVASNAPSSLVAEISSHNDAQTTSIDVVDMTGLLDVELNPGSSGSAPLPTFDDTGIVVEGDRSQWGGSTWTTAGNWMVYEYPEAPESITWEFDYRYDIFTNSNSLQDRGNRMLRVYNQDNNEIFRIWRTRNTIRFLEEAGNFRDIRSNNQALRSVVTGTTYTMRIEYNEHGNDEYRIYIDGAHQITVGDNRGGSYTNDAPGYLRFDGRDSGTRSNESTRVVIDYISDTFNQYEP